MLIITPDSDYSPPVSTVSNVVALYKLRCRILYPWHESSQGLNVSVTK